MNHRAVPLFLVNPTLRPQAGEINLHQVLILFEEGGAALDVLLFELELQLLPFLQRESVLLFPMYKNIPVNPLSVVDVQQLRDKLLCPASSGPVLPVPW